MDKEIEQIIEKLPKGWDEITLREFRKVLDVQVSEDDEFDGLFNGQDNTIKLLNILTGLSIETLMGLDVDIVIRMANKVEFLLQEPDLRGFKGSIRMKPIDKVSYGEYITFIMLSQDVFKNLDLLIKAFALNDFSDKDLEQLSMLEVYAAFFTLKQHVERYMKAMARWTTMKIVKLTFKEKIATPFRQKCNRLKQRFKKDTAGIFQ